MKITALVAALWAVPLHAQVVSFSPNQVRALAIGALENGRPDQAVIASDALIKQFPDDASALLLRTEAAISLGAYADAVAFGQRAFWHAVTDRQRFNASRLIALGHARQLQDSRAQLWLRAARQYAPNEAAADAVASDFRDVRRRNPLSTSFRFGITPSTNINGGSENDEIIINFNGTPLPFQFSEDARPLSGFQVSGRGSVRYRIRTDETSATFLDFGFSGNTHILTKSSKDDLEDLADRTGDPLKTGNYFSSARLNFGVLHRFVVTPDAGVTEAGLTYARDFRKDDDEAHFYSASLSHTFTLSETTSLSAFGVTERQRYVIGDDQSQTFRGQVTLNQTVDNIGRFSIGYGMEQANADRPDDEYDSIYYTVGFAPESEFLNASYGFNLTYRETDWDFFDNFNGARSDEIISFRATATLNEIELFGFNPVISFDRRVQDSTATRYETNSSSFGFDIVSSF